MARFLKAATPTDGATPKNTLEAMVGIAREPWADPKDLYTLFDEAYPQPKVMDFDGHPIGKESDFPFKEKFLGLMGIGVAANGDVWIADGSDNQLLYFPGGRVKDGRIVKVE